MESPSPESEEYPDAMEGADSSPSSGDSSSLSRIRFSAPSSPDPRENRESVSPIPNPINNPNAIETPPTRQPSPVLSSTARQQQIEPPLPSSPARQQSPNQSESEIQEEEEEEAYSDDDLQPIQPVVDEKFYSLFRAVFGHELILADDEEESDNEQEPPPRSPNDYPGYHPLSEEIKAKMQKSPFAPDLFTSDNQIKPSTCADPHDQTTWRYFRWVPKWQRRRLFSPTPCNHRPFLSGNLIPGISVFELISISIGYIDPIRGFSAISMRSKNSKYQPVIIYKLPEGKQITPGQPLPLKGPVCPLRAEDCLTFALSNPLVSGWCFSYEPRHPERLIYDQVIHEPISDEYSDSKADIYYELIQSAAIAQLSVTYVPHDKTSSVPDIVVLSGAIYASNEDKPETTRRLVQDFSSHTQFNDVLPLNRSIFGVPTASKLQVSMDFRCLEQGRPITVNEVLTFEAPRKTNSDDQTVLLRAGELKVTVKWWNYLY